MGFSNVQAIGEHIWFSNTKEKLLENRTPIIDYIGKFDWNGNPVKAYQVTGNLRTYGFDPAGNRIYGIALNADSMEPELVTASIN